MRKILEPVEAAFEAMAEANHPQHPKCPQNEVSGLQQPRFFKPRALEYEVFALVDVQGY